MIVERLKPNDRGLAADLLRELRVSVGGLESTSLYRAMCGSEEVRCLIARDGETLAGIALVELNRNWIWRRPWLTLRMALIRLQRKKAVGAAVVSTPTPLAAKPPLQWSDAAPRVLFIGVSSAWRGQGIGKALYHAMFDEIRASGYDHILARIAVDNAASLHLHRETGWVLYEGDGAVFAIKNLRPEYP